MKDYYDVVGEIHPDFLDPEFQINNLDVIAHWLVNGVPYYEDVKKLDPRTWRALHERYPKLSDFIDDTTGRTKGIHRFYRGVFYVSHVLEHNYNVKEPYTWYPDWEEALGKSKSQKL